MAGFKRIKTNKLNDVEKELVMAFRVAARKHEGLVHDNDSMNNFWWAFAKEFNERVSRLAKSRK